MRISFFGWLPRRKRGLKQAPRRAPRRVGLRLEALEDRVVPSTMHWVNRGNTSGVGNDFFNDVFGANATLARRVVDSALQQWANVIVDLKNGTNTIDVTIKMDPAKHT